MTPRPHQHSHFLSIHKKTDSLERKQKTIPLLLFLHRGLLLDGLEGVGVLLNQVLSFLLILLFCFLHLSLLALDDLQIVLVLCQFLGSHSRNLCGINKQGLVERVFLLEPTAFDKV